MTLDIVLIIIRIIFGSIAAAFLVSACLYKRYQTKHPIFETIFEYTGLCVFVFGLLSLIGFAILGE